MVQLPIGQLWEFSQLRSYLWRLLLLWLLLCSGWHLLFLLGLLWLLLDRSRLVLDLLLPCNMGIQIRIDCVPWSVSACDLLPKLRGPAA